MEKLLCNKCKNEIQRGVGGYKEGDCPVYFRIKVDKFSSIGQYMGCKEYDLCENCHNEFTNFKSYTYYGKHSENDNSHVDAIQTQYTVGMRENKDKSVLIGEEVTTNDEIKNSIQIGKELKNNKSVLKCGNTYWYSTKIFNKFQKKMWKKFFGIEIKEID